MSAAASLQTLAGRPKVSSHSNHAGLLLQRKCACGSPTASLTSECAECKSKKILQTKPAVAASNDSARRATANPVPTAHATRSLGVPPIVRQVIGSAGEVLDSSTRETLESRFGRDFSHVRVHHDASAAQSASAVNARAYTVGQHMVFGAGQYAPRTLEGRALLAHELTHTVQQRGTLPNLAALTLGSPNTSASEFEAEQARAAIRSDTPIGPVSERASSVIQRDEGSPAGGCGFCFGTPANAGTAAHTLISAALKRQNPTVQAPYALLNPSPGDENGVLDLVVFTRDSTAHIGEIKPANPRGLLQGDEDLFYYTTQLEWLGFKVRRLILPPPIEAIPFPTLAAAPCVQEQRLYVNPPVHGVYTYWCTPDYKILAASGCKCGKQDDKSQPHDQPFMFDRLEDSKGDSKSDSDKNRKGDGDSKKRDKPSRDRDRPRPSLPQIPVQLLALLALVAAFTFWGRIGLLLGSILRALGVVIATATAAAAAAAGDAASEVVPTGGGGGGSGSNRKTTGSNRVSQRKGTVAVEQEAEVIKVPAQAPAKPQAGPGAATSKLGPAQHKATPTVTKIDFIEGVNLTVLAPGNLLHVWLYEPGKPKLLAALQVRNRRTSGSTTTVEFKSLLENRDGKNTLGGNSYTVTHPFLSPKGDEPRVVAERTFTGGEVQPLISWFETLAAELNDAGRTEDAAAVRSEIQRVKKLAGI